MIIYTKTLLITSFADEVRAALNREAGETPALSRSCNAEALPLYVTGQLGRRGGTMKQSQKNCLTGMLCHPCERQEGATDDLLRMPFCLLQRGILFCA